jgi:3-hydroxyisobutyrate dehydrogenase-like beta-hydroxyacid dehydrogenase
MTAIGFAGLGAMGCQIAGRLLDGSQPYGSNRTPAKAAGLIERGMTWRNTPREIAEAAEVVFSMVTDDAALDSITSGPDGIVAGLAPGKIYVGGNGQGLLKLATSISLAAQMLAFSEGVLARAAELGYARRDIAALSDVLARPDLTPDGAAGRARSALAVSATGGNAR